MKQLGGALAGLSVLTGNYLFIANSSARNTTEQSSSPPLRSFDTNVKINSDYFTYLSISDERVGYHPVLSLFSRNFSWDPMLDQTPKNLFDASNSLFNLELWSLNYSQYSTAVNLVSRSLRDIKKDVEFVVPTYGDFTSGYGMRWGRMHNGIDVANSIGTPVVAAQHGLVSFAGWNGGYGYTVEILHSNGLTSRYAHLRSIGIKLHQSVKKGQFIGRMGATGHTTGPHLHFEIVTTTKQYLDPFSVFSHEEIKLKLNI